MEPVISKGLKALGLTDLVAGTESSNFTGNEYYEVRKIDGKGYGCVALQDIKRGTRILADSPLLIVPIAEYVKADVERPFEKLSPADQKLYFSLASGHGQDPKNWPSKIHESVRGRESQRIQEQHEARVSKEPSVVSIFQTNCMEWNEGAAVFPNAARFNHSCNPNANFTWNPAIEKETIHTINDVKKGDEITLSYCDMTHEKAHRTWELKHYGFVCDCPACTGSEEDPECFAYQSAERRFRIAELNRATKMLRGKRLEQAIGNKDWVPQMLELASLYKDEGDYTCRLADVHLDLALVCEQTGDLKHALEFAANALKVKRESQGADFPDYGKYKTVLRRINGKYKAQRP
ncbi:SET domain-containing protein [Byssothecium circinans]|uniref:SET domain-containing protein n=1 Tax=Byssothecium circinans TaxID=147558 RepID=A0A6A5TGA2_9PLEO|nr:SET domain-containing protein [Byssothecium circinans]